MSAVALDVGRSMIRLADVHFPAVGVECPPHPNDDITPAHHRVLGMTWRVPKWRDGDRPICEIYVPLENGLTPFLAIDTTGAGPRIDVYLYHYRCETSKMSGEPPIWVPGSMQNAGGCAFHRVGEMQMWTAAEADWAAEHLQRLARLKVSAPEGPECRLLSLTQCDAAYAELQAEWAAKAG